MSDTTTEAPATFTPRKLTEFELKVLAETLRAVRENGWCTDGANGALRRMGLPTIPGDYNADTYVIDVPTTGLVRYRINAATHAEALERAKELARYDSTSGRLNYGTKAANLTFDFSGITPEVNAPKTQEEADWVQATADLEALKAKGVIDTSDDEDDDDD